MSTTSKLNPNAQKWVDALRSGKYKQGRELQDEGYKIVSRYLPGNNTVHYFLLSDPRKPVKSARQKPAIKRRYRKTETDELKRVQLWAV